MITEYPYPKTLRALSIKQPYAGSIALGCKLEEYRSWKCSHRGLFLIHASANPEAGWREFFACFGSHYAALSLSAIIGAAKLLACDELRDGGYAWHIKDAIAFPEPLFCKGALAFWQPRDEAQEAAFAEAWRQIPEYLKK